MKNDCAWKQNSSKETTNIFKSPFIPGTNILNRIDVQLKRRSTIYGEIFIAVFLSEQVYLDASYNHVINAGRVYIPHSLAVEYAWMFSDYKADWNYSIHQLVLFCFVLFCFVLFCFVLFCFVLFCFGCYDFGRLLKTRWLSSRSECDTFIVLYWYWETRSCPWGMLLLTRKTPLQRSRPPSFNGQRDRRGTPFKCLSFQCQGRWKSFSN